MRGPNRFKKYVDWYYEHHPTESRMMGGQSKKKKLIIDRDALVEIASLLTLAHVQVARALTLAQAAGFEAIVTETKTIAESIRREAAVAISSATKGDG